MKIVIVGKGKGWHEAPECGEGYEVWGITQLNLRRDVNLAIDMNDYSGNKWGPQETIEAIQSRNKAVRDEVPYIDLLTYPFKEIVEKFGTDYFSSTVTFAIALAIHKGATEIECYGFSYEDKSEYLDQRPCVEAWLWFAKGLGIKVTVFGEYTTLFKTPDGKVYGYNLKQGGKLWH